MSFLSLDGTVVVQLINFVIFFAILNVVFLRPVAAAISKRRAYINGLVSDYDSYQAEAQTLRAEAEGVRNAARREAQHQIAVARAAASNDVAEISSRYNRDAQGIVEEADRTVRAELDAARAGERDAVRRIADVMLERAVPEAGT